MKFLVLLVFSVCSWSSLAWTEHAQRQYVFDTWGLADGLPQVSVLDIVQDEQGYIWLATQSGLARFDGVAFAVYDRTNTPQLPASSIEQLYIDAKQRMWVATTHGVAMLQDGQWFEVSTGGMDYGVISGFAETDDGLLLIATTAGILFVDEDLKFKRFGGERAAFDILVTDEQVVYIGGQGVVNMISEYSHEYWDLPNPAQRAQALLLTDQGLWIGTSKGLLLRSDDGAFAAPLAQTPWAEEAVESISLGPDGALWIGTYSALLRLQSDGSIQALDESVFGFLPWVVALRQDMEGNLWAGSQTHGVIRIWPGWTSRIDLGSELEDAFVWSVIESTTDDAIWVGTNNGLWRVADQTEKVLGRSQLPNPAVYTLAEESGSLWVGTRSGLALLQGDTFSEPWPTALGGRQINAIHVHDTALWVASDDGLFISWDRSTLSPLADEMGLEAKRLRVLHTDVDGQLWVGAERGLFKRGGDGLFVRESPEALAQAFVTAISSDEQIGLLVGTYDAGLFVRPSPSDQWRNIRREDGVPTNSSFHLQRLGDYLWVSSTEGVYRIPVADLLSAAPVNGQMLVSAQPSFKGAQFGRCCNGAGLARGMVADGAVWYPTLDGVMGLFPERVRPNSVPPPVVIEAISVRDERLVVSESSVQQSIGHRDIEIHFTATSFQNPDDVAFRYRLLGYDPNWLDAGPRRSAFYTNLSAGEYRFEVEAFNNSGVRSEQPAVVTFTITQRFYETHWFTLLLGLAVALTIYLAHRLRLHALNQRQKELEAKVAERTNELAAANRRLLSANRALREASERDELTGLRNRRFMSHQLRDFDDARSPEQNEDMHSVLMLVDIDFFKRINDTYGHARGDEVLQQFSALLLELTRESDHVLRWGGEEFLMILEHSGSEQAGGVAERLRCSVAEHRFVLTDQTVLQLTCSIGFSIFPVLDRWPDAVSWRACLELADRALYAVKASGRDGWASLDPTDKARPEHFHSGFTHRLDELFAQDVIRWLASHDQMRLPDRQVSAR